MRAGLLLVCLLLVGCGWGGPAFKVYPVSGLISVKGKSPVGAAVHFHPRDKKQCPPAFAVVQADGMFQLTTYTKDDGAAAGEYVVTVTWRDERTEDGELIFGPDRLGDRYSRPTVSGLKATIAPGTNFLPPFDLQ